MGPRSTPRRRWLPAWSGGWAARAADSSEASAGGSWTAWGGRLSLGDRAAVVLGLVVLGLFTLLNEKTPGETSHSFDLIAAALLAGAIALLLVSRRFPATAAALLVGVSIVWYSRYTSRLVDVPTIVGFYVLGTTGDRRRQLVVGGFAVALLILGAAGDTSDTEIAVEGVGWTVAAILSGELVRSRRLLLDEYSERAARAEAERDAEAERQVASERLRIARDLHDVLAHTVSVMTVQAGVAADAFDRGGDRDTVRSALATLRSTGKEAMAEVRATVSVLRDAGTGGGGLDTAPAPDLARVADLVDTARTQGLEVELTLDLSGIEADNLVELTAYRVVQESLTNVVRHAGASSVAVRLHGDTSGRLVVEVVDDGRATSQPSPGSPGWPGSLDASGPGEPPPPRAATSPHTPAPISSSVSQGTSGSEERSISPAQPGAPTRSAMGSGHVAGGPGFGLRGMGERDEAVGGELSYGPMPGRGWAVRAVLPMRSAPSSRRPGNAGEPGEAGGARDAGPSGEARPAREELPTVTASPPRDPSKMGETEERQ